MSKEISEKKVPAGGAKHLVENHLNSHVNFLPDASLLLFQRSPKPGALSLQKRQISRLQ
jgi:hypothetical protein